MHESERAHEVQRSSGELEKEYLRRGGWCARPSVAEGANSTRRDRMGKEVVWRSLRETLPCWQSVLDCGDIEVGGSGRYSRLRPRSGALAVRMGSIEARMQRANLHSGRTLHKPTASCWRCGRDVLCLRERVGTLARENCNTSWRDCKAAAQGGRCR